MPQTQSYNHFYERMIGTEYKFAWLPQRCDISGKQIWLKNAYRITRMTMTMVPGDIIFEHRWHDKLEHLFWKLKR
jgi:hypothetical protein